jgi:alkylation response protein AidB-like acyl-CoA dehydrogenase
VNFDLDENQALFKDTVERFCAPVDIAARTQMRRNAVGFDRKRWSELAELGMIGLAAGEADGGLGGSLLDCAVVAQALGHGLAVEPWLECAFLPAKILAGTEHAARVVDGSIIATLAFAEAAGRYTLDARAVTVKGGKLSGEKRFVLSAAAADLLIVTANVEGQTHLFAVPRDARGVDVRLYPVTDGSLAGVVTFRDVSVGQSFASIDHLVDVINETRLMAAAEMVGAAQRLFADTLDYVKTREQFGQPLGRFQVIQHRMVDVYSKCEAIQSALFRALLQPGSNAEAVKGFVAEEAVWVAQQAVQLHGGMGMTDELGIGHALKRILLLSKLFGDPASGYAQLAKAA